MESIEKTIEVEAPVSKVYNQWTQFEQFPLFMEGIEQVRQLDDQHLHWVAEIGGKKKEWDAEITQQIPDQRIAWRSTGGATNAGVVTFRPKDGNHTIINVTMTYDPQGMMESVADALGLLSRRVEGDLQRFRDFIQQRTTETGAWRGQIAAEQNLKDKDNEYDSSGKSGLEGSH
jgi:uncharacterized membrane protein